MRSILLTTALCVAIAGPAFAWDTVPANPPPAATIAPVSMSNATANATAGSMSRSNARATGGNATTGPVSVYQANNSGGGLMAATAMAPGIVNYGPCPGSGVGVAGQVPGGGVSIGLGGGHEKECQIERLGNLQTAAQRIDHAYQCEKTNWLGMHDEDFRRATAKAGFPCPGDALKPEPVAYERDTRPDWCMNLSDAAERRTYADVCKLGPQTQIPRHGI